MQAKASNAAIARALLAQYKDGKKMDQLVRSLAAFLTTEHRQADAQAIVRELERILFNTEGKLYVHAASAYALGDTQKAEITRIFSQQTAAKDVIIQETIDPDVIGGVRLQTADHQLDLTVQRQLQRLKHAGTAYSA